MKYEIVFDHVGDNSPSILGQYETMKEAKDAVKVMEAQDLGQTMWMSGRRGYIGYVGGRMTFNVRIEVYGTIK